MKHLIAIAAMTASLLVASAASAQSAIGAAWTVLSDRLSSDSAVAPSDLHVCGYSVGALPYSLTPFTVAEPGEYGFVNASWYGGMDTYFAIYEGDFDPLDPTDNMLAQQSSSWYWEEGALFIELQPGKDYQLLVSPWCYPSLGTWTLAVSGPGKIHSRASVDGLDSFLQGRIDESVTATADFGCGQRRYRSSGPQRVDQTSIYHLNNVSAYFYSRVCVAVYDRPFDPQRPAEGRLAVLQDLGVSVNLATGKDYYFLSALNSASANDDYFYLILPEGDVYFDPVMAGSWYNPATPGQGFFLDVMGRKQKAFLGWFTFDVSDQPGMNTDLGDGRHRWLTGLFDYEDDLASGHIELTTGATFNQSAPAASQKGIAYAGIRLLDCEHAIIDILFVPTLPGVEDEVSIPVRRINSEGARPCLELMQQAGKPRPLFRQ